MTEDEPQFDGEASDARVQTVITLLVVAWLASMAACWFKGR